MIQLLRSRHRLGSIAALLAGCLLTGSAAAQELIRQVPPMSWLDPYLPEKLPAVETRAYDRPIDIAAKQVFAGRYKQALITLHQVDASADPVRVALLRAEALDALGREQKALEQLDQPQVQADPEVQLLRVRILAKLGKFDDALTVLRQHLDAHPQSLQGRYLLGHLLETTGDIDSATAAYAWFVEPPQQFDQKWQARNNPIFDSAADTVTIARAIDRWANLTLAYRDNRRLHDQILSMFVRAYDVIDRGYWPAHVAAAEYFLAHDQEKQAAEELDAALKMNPNALDALCLAGRIALDNWNFDGAEQMIRRIRAVDPNNLAAAVLEARNLLRQRKPAQAESVLLAVLDRQPNHIEAMGLLAGSYALQLRDQEMRQLLQRVEQIDPDNAPAYLEVAEQLAALRQYPRSAEMYKIAIERAPWWPAARNGLGLLYTQSGDEDEAREILEAAYALDPFNFRTTNYLRLLDDLAGFARHETEHFIVLYDAQADPVIPEYFGDYMERIHGEIADVFKHEPAVKTLIEVFPSHDAFSVRTTGSPWIGTVGASTGRVIALVSPRDAKETLGSYNWAQVLRHEYVHTVTLSATDNRISHWMTEGLAVLEERSPMPWSWIPMLHYVVTHDELFTMDALTWGFVRPRRPIDRQLAYAQSFWICKYIQETYGHDRLLAMMQAFKEGKDQDQVFVDVLGRTTSQFTEEFFAWTRQQIAGWGYDQQTTRQYESLRREGEELIKSRQFEKAAEVWEQAAALRPVDPLPHQRLAGVYLRLKQTQKAIDHLDRLHRASLKDNRYALTIARLYRDAGDLAKATQYATEAIHIAPYDLRAHQLLAELYEKSGDQQQLERERRVIAALEQLRSTEQR